MRRPESKQDRLARTASQAFVAEKPDREGERRIVDEENRQAVTSAKDGQTSRAARGEGCGREQSLPNGSSTKAKGGREDTGSAARREAEEGRESNRRDDLKRKGLVTLSK